MRQENGREQVAMPGDAKIRNRQMMLRAIRSGQAVTAADIHQSTGISRPTAMRFLQHLCQCGAVAPVGFGESTRAGGKKPELFRFSDQRRILCVNLWPETITLALSGLVGQTYDAEENAHRLTPCLDDDLARVKELAQAYLARRGLSLAGLYGVALTVPGTVDYAAQTLRYNSQAPGWGTEVSLGQRLRGLLGEGLAYYIDNAGKAAGRALLLERPEYAQKRLMTFFTTWGVSACLLDRGRALSGRDSLIGEIGHMIICDTDDELCGCGKRGCLESMVSLNRVRRLLAGWGASPAECEGLTFQGLFAASAAGEPRARRAAEYLAHCFAVALQNLSLAYNQETVVFQGDFAWADAHFDACLKAELSQFRYYPRGGLFEIVYDKRNLACLAAQGGAGELIKKYFDDLARK